MRHMEDFSEWAAGWLAEAPGAPVAEQPATGRDAQPEPATATPPPPGPLATPPAPPAPPVLASPPPPAEVAGWATRLVPIERAARAQPYPVAGAGSPPAVAGVPGWAPPTSSAAARLRWADPGSLDTERDRPAPVDEFRTRRRRSVRLVTALELLLLVGGVGWGAYRLESTGRARVTSAALLTVTAGSPSPQAAVEALFSAAGRGDLAAAIASLAPGEQAALGGEMSNLVAQLVRLDVLAPGTTLASYPGFKLTFDDVGLSTRQVSPTLAAVTLESGTVTASADPSAVPIGSFVEGLLDGPVGSAAMSQVIEIGPRAAGTPPAASASSSGAGIAAVGGTGAPPVRSSGPVTLVTELVGGSWYVSLGWSVAAQSEISAGRPFEPPAGSPVVPSGSPSPDAAVGQLIADAASFDLAGVLADLPPGEVGPVQAYAGQYLPAAQQGLALASSRVQVSVDGMQLGDEALSYGELVKVGDLQLTAVVDVGELGTSGRQATARITLDGSCVTIEMGQMSEHECGAGAAQPGQLSQLQALLPAGVSSSLRRLVGEQADIGLVTVEENGSWYVSPTATVLHTLVAELEELQPSDLQAWASFVRDPAAIRRFVAGLASLEAHPASLLAATLG